MILVLVWVEGLRLAGLCHSSMPVGNFTTTGSGPGATAPGPGPARGTVTFTVTVTGRLQPQVDLA